MKYARQCLCLALTECALTAAARVWVASCVRLSGSTSAS
jgi:hypothetical protein